MPTAEKWKLLFSLNNTYNISCVPTRNNIVPFILKYVLTFFSEEFSDIYFGIYLCTESSISLSQLI